MARWIGCLCLLAFIPVFCLSSDQDNENSLERFEFSQFHMGKTMRLVVYASDKETAAEACRTAFRRIAELDQIMSDYREDSELMQLVDRAGEGPQPVSKDLMTVLQMAQQAADRTQGAFDVTVRPLSQIWRKAIYQDKQLPDPETIRNARERVGWRKLILNPEAGTAELTQPGMGLDLGGIGKGFAADAALAALADHGLERALCQAGGEIVVGQRPPGRPGWRIRHPFLDEFIHAEHQAISTSGDTEQFLEVDGVRYSHVVDPRTGKALAERYYATVIASDGATADMLSTAATVLGPESMEKLMERWYPDASLFIRQLR